MIGGKDSLLLMGHSKYSHCQNKTKKAFVIFCIFLFKFPKSHKKSNHSKPKFRTICFGEEKKIFSPNICVIWPEMTLTQT